MMSVMVMRSVMSVMAMVSVVAVLTMVTNDECDLQCSCINGVCWYMLLAELQCNTM